jgi:hypothetical protein
MDIATFSLTFAFVLIFRKNADAEIEHLPIFRALASLRKTGKCSRTQVSCDVVFCIRIESKLPRGGGVVPTLRISSAIT